MASYHNERMSETGLMDHSSQVHYENPAKGSWHFIAVLAREYRRLLGVPFLAAVLAMAISFLFPNTYRSDVTILPPERTFQSMETPLSELSLLAGGGMVLPIMATPSDILAAVLMSRTVRDSLVTDYDLTTRWDMTLSEASEALRGQTGSDVELSGIVTVWVTSKNRMLADSLANGLVARADQLNRTIVNTKARRTREFVEKRLLETEDELDGATARLTKFQNEHRTVALEAQIEQLIKNAAELQAQINSDEIELSVMEQTYSGAHPRVQLLRSRIRETHRRLDGMQSTTGSDTSETFGATLEELPGLVQELAEITRDVKVAENLFTLLTAQYENARIQEQRDTPSFSVLDPASGGGQKVRPMRTLIGLATFVSMFALMLAIVVGREYVTQLGRRDPAQYEAMRSVLDQFRRGKR